MFSKLVVLATAAVSVAGAADVRIVEEIIAKVNGDIITRGDLQHSREALEQDLRQHGETGARLEEDVQQQSKDMLRNQIDQLLLVQRAKDLNLKVDADVTRQLAEYQVESKIADPEQFHQWLQQQTGMPFEDFKQKMTDSLLTQKVISEEIGQRINIPEADMRKYYEDHKKDFVRQETVFLSQILISTEGKTPEQIAAAQKKAADLVQRARKGEKFSELAKANSDDTETAKNGGELPPYKRSDGLLRKEIADVVFAQKKGYVTDPIKVPQGLLILRVDDHYEAGQASFEEVKDEVMQRMAAPLMQPKVREYLTKLRQDAFLQIKDGFVDTGAAPGKDTRWADAVELKPETTTKEEVAAHHKKKLLWVIPVGSAGKPADASQGSANFPGSAAPAGAPAPAK
ncbi:MAG TPA: peptidyl-prolyl cis-trans isomerase [Bryobacteraceae bacterium]|nr:peptidyl-prolyl cis-trans isomerase [Bryobacteraceae bacterium]